MSKKILLLITLIAVAIISPLKVFGEELTFPEQSGYVNDFENILTIDQGLEVKLTQFEKETSIEVTVVTTPDFQDTYIEDYAVKLFEEWGIGKKDEDNGLLILVSSAMHESRIEVGYGLEGELTDAKTGKIQDKFMIPYFKEDDYDTGISKGIDAALAELGGEEFDNRVDIDSAITEESIPEQSPIIGILLFAFILLIVLSGPKNFWVGGIIGFITGIVAGYILLKWTGMFLLPIPLAILGVILSLSKPILLPILLSGLFRGSGGRGSGSSGGFGGFGGGSSGGGGSSRSW